MKINMQRHITVKQEARRKAIIKLGDKSIKNNNNNSVVRKTTTTAAEKKQKKIMIEYLQKYSITERAHSLIEMC
jgi:hypothetical protein